MGSTEIRWHGRAGQGVVSVAQIVAKAALIEGKHVQAFPEFGPERLGAPIKGFDRISDEPIEIHSQIYSPDVVVVIDPSILRIMNVADGLKKEGILLINTDKSPEDIKKEFNLNVGKLYTVNATRIAIDMFGKALFNTPMLGALVKVSGAVSLDSVIAATKDRFPGELGEKNVAAIKRAHSEVSG